jgi:signal transduction histidine kinase
MPASELEALRRQYAQLETELGRLRRMEQLLGSQDANFELLVRGLAHDFNNLLGGILGHASLIESATAPESEIHESAQIIRNAAERAGELTHRFLHNSTGVQFLPQDLHLVVREVVRLVSPSFPASVRVRLALEAAPPKVSGIGTELYQLVLNLVTNAIQAMPDGGELSVLTRRTLDQMVELVVRDTGPGMPPEVQAHVFEPFYSTKQGMGAGMGLAVVQRVAKNHGGRVELESALGAGTAFRVLIPAMR